MKLILLQDIKGVGKKFDVKEIKSGYARNFLLPRGLVKAATEQSIKELEIKKAAWGKEEKEIKGKLELLAKSLTESEFDFSVKTGKKGEVFGSVNKEDIKNKLYEYNGDFKKISDFEIILERPLKTLGEHQLEINFGKGIKSKIKVTIAPISPISQ